jgi:proline iminopeptidase
MKSRLHLSLLCLITTLSGCKWFKTRETIFDHVVNIPKNLVFYIPYIPPLCNEITDLKKEFVEIENGKLYCEQEGQGIPLVLINGGPGGTHHGFHPYFSQIKDIARTIYYDQRGTGKSSKDDTGTTYTIDQAVQDLESLRQALKINKWVVLGHSYGGLLAQLYALKYPQHCTHLILVASIMGLTKTKIKPSRKQMFFSQEELDAIEKIDQLANEGKLPSAQVIYNKHLAGEWKHYYYYKPTNVELILKARYEWDPAPGFEKKMRPEMFKTNLKGKFENFKTPTLIIEGKWDLHWNTDKAEILHQNHPHAQLEIFEKSGHSPFKDEPDKFFSLLRKVLQK